MYCIILTRIGTHISGSNFLVPDFEMGNLILEFRKNILILLGNI